MCPQSPLLFHQMNQELSEVCTLGAIDSYRKALFYFSLSSSEARLLRISGWGLESSCKPSTQVEA